MREALGRRRGGREASRLAGSAGAQVVGARLAGARSLAGWLAEPCPQQARRGGRQKAARAAVAVAGRKKGGRGAGPRAFPSPPLTCRLRLPIDEAFRVASERAPGGPALPCSLSQGKPRRCPVFRQGGLLSSSLPVACEVWPSSPRGKGGGPAAVAVLVAGRVPRRVASPRLPSSPVGGVVGPLDRSGLCDGRVAPSALRCPKAGEVLVPTSVRVGAGAGREQRSGGGAAERAAGAKRAWCEGLPPARVAAPRRGSSPSAAAAPSACCRACRSRRRAPGGSRGGARLGGSLSPLARPFSSRGSVPRRSPAICSRSGLGRPADAAWNGR